MGFTSSSKMNGIRRDTSSSSSRSEFKLLLSHMALAACTFYLGLVVGMTKAGDCPQFQQHVCPPCQRALKEEIVCSPCQRELREQKECPPCQQQHVRKEKACPKCPEPIFQQQAETAQRKTESTGPKFPTSVKELFVGAGRVNREAFTRKYDVGVPISPSTPGNEDVIMLYGRQSLPTVLESPSSNASLDTLPLLPSPEEATQNCISMSMIFLREDEYHQCLAIVGQWPSHYVHKWMRVDPAPNKEPSLTEPFRYVSRTNSLTSSYFIDVPARHWVDNFYKFFTDYVTQIDDALERLKPVADAVVKGKKDPTIIVMVCNHGQSELFMNFVCSARSRGLDTSQILLFATDLEMKQLAEALGINTYYDEKLFKDLPKTASEYYGDNVFSMMMLAKMYCVHLINRLEYNLLFQDVDIVWYKHPFDFFNSPKAGDFDMYFQDDGARTTRYEPYSANTGFYFIRYNKQTEYFLSCLLRLGDVVTQASSHQQALHMVLNEHTSLYGLRVKVLSREEEEFPGGYNFHRTPDYMKKLVAGKVEPYIFHMSWTENKMNKRLFLEQLGNFFVSDKCVGKTINEVLDGSSGKTSDLAASCCLAQPVEKCHYRDKPSRTPCKDSPILDEGQPSFW